MVTLSEWGIQRLNVPIKCEYCESNVESNLTKFVIDVSKRDQKSHELIKFELGLRHF